MKSISRTEVSLALYRRHARTNTRGCLDHGEMVVASPTLGGAWPSAADPWAYGAQLTERQPNELSEIVETVHVSSSC